MKRILLAIIGLFILNSVFSAPIITATTSGQWDNINNWNLNRLPEAGDTIVIPVGRTVTVSNDQTINGFGYIKLFGKLNFVNNNSTLRLGSTSSILVYSGGTVEGGGSPSQKIRIGANTIFEGGDAPINGPQALTQSGITSFSQAPLPVRFVGFTASVKAKDALIQWATSQEENASIYEVQRSFDGNNWTAIAYVTAAGNTNTTTNYSFTDKNITSTAHYRIKQVDMDGRFSYTPVRSIKIGSVETGVVKIASAQGNVLLQFAQEVKGNVVVRFITTSGQLVSQQTLNQPVGQVILNTHALKGNYVVSVSGTEVNTASKVLL